MAGLFAEREQETFVIPLEALAITAPYLCEELADSIRGKLVVHCADNKAANAGALRGFSGSRDLARIAGDTRWAWHRLGVDPWVEYVASKANLADWPSRGEYAWLVAQGGARVTFNMPTWLM